MVLKNSEHDVRSKAASKNNVLLLNRNEQEAQLSPRDRASAAHTLKNYLQFYKCTVLKILAFTITPTISNAP